MCLVQVYEKILPELTLQSDQREEKLESEVNFNLQRHWGLLTDKRLRTPNLILQAFTHTQQRVAQHPCKIRTTQAPTTTRSKREEQSKSVTKLQFSAIN